MDKFDTLKNNQEEMVAFLKDLKVSSLEDILKNLNLRNISKDKKFQKQRSIAQHIFPGSTEINTHFPQPQQKKKKQSKDKKSTSSNQLFLTLHGIF